MVKVKAKCPDCKITFEHEVDLSEAINRETRKVKEQAEKKVQSEAKKIAKNLASQEIQTAKNLANQQIKIAKEQAESKSQLEAKKIIDKERKQKDLQIDQAKKAARATALNEAQKKLDQEKADREKDKNLAKLKEERLIKDLEKIKRRKEQGLTADQGTSQEMTMENFLKDLFKDYDDEIISIKKGEAGGDVVQKIKNQGIEIGRILYESKETGSFSNKWIGKLQSDMKDTKASVGVIYTVALPKDFNKKKGFKQKGNIFVCKYNNDALGFLAQTQRFMLAALYEKNQGQNKDNRTSADEFFMMPNVQNTFHLVDTHFISLGQNIEKSLKDLYFLIK